MLETKSVHDKPVYVDYFAEDIVAVAPGYEQTLFLTESRRLYAVGKND